MVAPFRLDSLREQEAGEPAAQSADGPSDGPSDQSGPGRPEAPPAGGGRRRGVVRRMGPVRALLVVLIVLVILVGGVGSFAGLRLSKADPAPGVTQVLQRDVAVPARSLAPSLPWPKVGQGAVAIPAIGVDVASGPEQPVPVASLTKLMTAYVVLRDHPLVPNDPGPVVTVTQADVADYQADMANGDSTAVVAAGEQLTELQLLGGLLVHSADNYADLLADWDGGSIPAFVTEMNDAAARLGMRHTRFADASGVDAGSVSTAADILKVAALDMANPVVDALVRMPSVTLPLAGTIATYTPFLGFDGVIGVKSGFTTAAGGNDVLAVRSTIHGRPTLLLAAVTGQQGAGVLGQAGLHGLALVNALAPLVGATAVLGEGDVVAHVSSGGQDVDGRAGTSVSMLTWPGVTARRVFVPVRHLTDRARRGAVVGSVVVTIGAQRVVVPVRLSHDLRRPTMLQKLF
jgi:D-alanyl-D-alanine carboxypeptidase (penicillin-binding protein 5/6)